MCLCRVRTGVRNAAVQTQGAASGAATVGKGIKGATAQGGAVKDFYASGGRTWWSHMPKTPQLPGGLADVSAYSDSDQHSQTVDKSDWCGHSTNEDVPCLDSLIADSDLLALRTDTPADVLLSIMSDMLEGREPDLREVALARSALLGHLDLYEPLNGSSHIRNADLDADVVHALMHQLGAGAPNPRPTAPEPPADLVDTRSPDLTRTPSLRGAVASASAAAAAPAAGMQGSGAATGDNVDKDEDVLAEESLREALAALLGLMMPATASLPPALQRCQDLVDEAELEESGSSWGSGSDSDGNLQLYGSESVPLPQLDEVERLLALADSCWQYDTWQLAEVTQGHALSCLGFYLLHREGLITQFRIQPTKLARLLRALESGYPSNPYHNSTHAADVLQTLHVLLRGSGLTVHYLDRLGLMAAYFAAIVHDHGHPGLTADFLIATSDPLAVRYNDRAPLENHHGASFFTLMQQPGMDVLGHLTAPERMAFRKQVLELVLATDMKQHFSLLAHFNTAHQLTPYNMDTGPWALARSGARGDGGGSRQQLRTLSSRWGREEGGRRGGLPEAGKQLQAWSRSGEDATGGTAGSDGDAAATGPEAGSAVPAATTATCNLSYTYEGIPRPSDETQRVLSLQIALKTADLGHLGEALPAHIRWVRCLEEEFFRQGDLERSRELPVSPLFDRSKQGVSKGQVGFYDFIALPLVHSLASAFPGVHPLLACFVDNYDHWRGVDSRAAAAVAGAGAGQQQQQQ